MSFTEHIRFYAKDFVLQHPCFPLAPHKIMPAREEEILDRLQIMHGLIQWIVVDNRLKHGRGISTHKYVELFLAYIPDRNALSPELIENIQHKSLMLAYQIVDEVLIPRALRTA